MTNTTPDAQTIAELRRTIEELGRTMRAQSRHARDLTAENRALRRQLKELEKGQSSKWLDVMQRALMDALRGRMTSIAQNGATAQYRADMETLLLLFFDQHAAAPPEFFRPEQLAKGIGASPGAVGRVLQDMIPVYQVKGKGYRSADVYREISLKQETLLLMFFDQHAAVPPEFFRPEQLAKGIGSSPKAVGRALQAMIPVYQVEGKGYRSADVYREISLKQEAGHNGTS